MATEILTKEDFASSGTHLFPREKGRNDVVDYLHHLVRFLDRAAKDGRLGPVHVSMYISIFTFWNASQFKNPISISRGEVMRLSKISANATYHKCMKELNNYGYLRYEPSFSPKRRSLVYLLNFERDAELGNEQEKGVKETGCGLSEGS